MSKKSKEVATRRRAHKVLVPPVWSVLLITLVGIYATGLVYNAVVDGAWRGGIVGAVLLALAVYATGTPLAASMWNHRAKKAQRKANDGARSI